MLPGAAPTVIERWAERIERRVKLSPLAVAGHTELGPLNQWIHIWAYKDAAERFRIRDEARARRRMAAQHPRPIRQAGEHAGRSLIVLPAALAVLRARRETSGAPAAGPDGTTQRNCRKSRGVVVYLRRRSGAGEGALGSVRTGICFVAANMKRRQVCAGNEPPVTLFIGELSSLPNHTPATRSAV